MFINQLIEFMGTIKVKLHEEEDIFTYFGLDGVKTLSLPGPRKLDLLLLPRELLRAPGCHVLDHLDGLYKSSDALALVVALSCTEDDKVSGKRKEAASSVH